MNKKFLIKFLISSILLFIVLKSINLKELTILLKNLDIIYIVLAIISIYLGIFISSLKWKILLSEQKINVNLKEVFSAYYYGMFFNNFLPSTIGGDFMRAKIISNKRRRLSKVLVSVLFDRYLGIMALSFLALMGSVSSMRLGYPPTITIFGVSFFLFTLLITIIFFKYNLKLKERLFSDEIDKFLLNFYNSLRKYKKLSKGIINSVILSFIFQGISILCTIFIVKSLGLEISLGYLFLIIPLVSLFSMIPLSINGIGLREASYVFFFSKLNLSATSALTVSFLTFSILVIVSLIGGIIFTIKSKN